MSETERSRVDSATCQYYRDCKSLKKHHIQHTQTRKTKNLRTGLSSLSTTTRLLQLQVQLTTTASKTCKTRHKAHTKHALQRSPICSNLASPQTPLTTSILFCATQPTIVFRFGASVCSLVSLTAIILTFFHFFGLKFLLLFN